MNWLYTHWLSVIMMVMLVLFLVWLFGYFRNGEYGTHYDLQSCWAGVGAIATASAAGFGKWWIDSTKNSNQGEMPSVK